MSVFVVRLSLLGIIPQAVFLAQHVEGHGYIIQRLNGPLPVVALPCSPQCQLVVAKRQSVVAHIVVHVAKHAVQIPLESRQIQVAGQQLCPFHRQHRLVHLLLPVQDDAMVEQGSGEALIVSVALIEVPAGTYQRV